MLVGTTIIEDWLTGRRPKPVFEEDPQITMRLKKRSEIEI